MSSLSTLLNRVFRSYGYEILRDAEHNRYILAKKDNIILAVGYLTSETVPTRKDIRNFIRTTINDGAHKSVFVSVEELDDDIRQMLRKQNVEVWERDKVEREIGRALLGGLSESCAEPGEGLMSFMDMPRSEPADITERHEIMIPFTLGESPSKISGEKSSETEIETGLTIMEPRISREEATVLTKKIVRSYRFDLQLVPYYIFDFSCEVIEGTDRKKKLNKGTLGINSLSNTVEEWPDRFNTVTTLEQEYTKLEPAFTLEEAQQLIAEAVIAINTREVETIEDKGSAIIIEKKKITPKEDVMEISSRGTVYMPVWCVEGSNGLITVDATSGKIIKEDIYKDKNVSFL